MSMNRLVMAVTSASAAGLITGLVLIGTSLLRDDVVDQPAQVTATDDRAVDVLGTAATSSSPPADDGPVTEPEQPAAVVAPPPAQPQPGPTTPPPDVWPPSVITGTITAVGQGCYTVTADGRPVALYGTDGSIPVGTNVEVGLIPGGAPATPCAGDSFYVAYINVR